MFAWLFWACFGGVAMLVTVSGSGGGHSSIFQLWFHAANGAYSNQTEMIFSDRGNVDFVDCGPGNLQRLMLSGCDPRNRTHCIIQRGGTLGLQADFIPGKTYSTARTEVILKTRFYELHLERMPFIEQDACKGYVQCPLVGDELSQAIARVYLPFMLPNFGYPKISAKLLGANNETIVCGQVKVGYK